MRITYLIGNGFDLNLGLNTKYNDFLNQYKSIDSDDNEIIKFFKTDILCDEGLWSNAEKAFGIATLKFKENGYNALAYCECHEDFCNNLATYLFNEEQRINFEERGYEFSKCFLLGIISYKKAFREVERAQIEASEKKVGNGYVFNFINFNYTYTLDFVIETSMKNISLLPQRRVNNTLYNNSIGEVMHVHGTINRDMVLGVNDISQILEPSIFDEFDEEFISQIIKQRTNEMNGENIDRKVHELLNKSDLIYIYGMSIGITDRLWWERICKLMVDNKNLHVIIHKYDAPQDGLILTKTISYKKRIIEEFLDFSDLDEQIKEELKTRIHIDKSNIFSGLENIVYKNS